MVFVRLDFVFLVLELNNSVVEVGQLGFSEENGRVEVIGCHVSVADGEDVLYLIKVQHNRHVYFVQLLQFHPLVVFQLIFGVFQTYGQLVGFVVDHLFGALQVLPVFLVGLLLVLVLDNAFQNLFALRVAFDGSGVWLVFVVFLVVAFVFFFVVVFFLI